MPSFAAHLLAGSLLLALPCRLVAAPPTRFTTVFQIPGHNDGSAPVSALIKLGHAYFGTAFSGGDNNAGTVFKIDADTGEETTLHSFGAAGDGATPIASLTEFHGILYGTTMAGGSADAGIVFKIDPSSGTETILCSFAGFPSDSGPAAPLVAFRGALYGTTATGGKAEDGTIFKIDPDTGAETSLYTFGTAGVDDGNFPHAGMIVAGNVLYGTTFQGGKANSGTLFRFDPATNTETQLYALNGGTDGAIIEAPLLAFGGMFYGTANAGGKDNAGTVFSFDSDTANYAVLHTFQGGADGGSPSAGLISDGTTLYGTTAGFNTQSFGTVFSLDPSTKNETVLYRFGGGYDGAAPTASLLIDGNLLLGVAESAGFNNSGVAFSVDPASQTETVLHQFSGSDFLSTASPLTRAGTALYGSATGGGTLGFGAIFRVDAKTGAGTTVYSFKGGNDGLSPSGTLVDSGGTLYGTTAMGGTANLGTVFKLDAQGLRTRLHDFTGGTDGARPQGGLLALGTLLYGTTYEGGASNNGTLFAIDPASGTETILHNFAGPDDGSLPWAPLIRVNSTLYGTTLNGGAGHNGVVFAYDTTTNTEATVHAFQGADESSAPFAPVSYAGGLLYGTTSGYGNKITAGAVFSINPASGAATVLHDFKQRAKGEMPLGGVTDIGNLLYGTTAFGGLGEGTIFSLDPATGTETKLYAFTGGADSGIPEASLVKAGPFLWGTTVAGAGNAGTVFKYKPR